MITLFARLKAKPGKESILEQELIKVAKEVKENEKGCIMYIPHVSTENTAEFVFIEKYVDQNAFDSHFETPYFKALAQKFDDLLDGPPFLERLDEVSIK